MNDLLREFLTEAHESLDVVDVELVRFEREPNNAELLGRIFRLVHTIKGTCGFLGLPRLEALTHAAETLMGKFRDGMPVTEEAVTLANRDGGELPAPPVKRKPIQMPGLQDVADRLSGAFDTRVTVSLG